MKKPPDPKPLRVPREEDWGDYASDLDRNYAHGIFAGRTNLEVAALIRANPIERVGDLRWMPAVPFRYYVLGLRDLILANDFDDLDASDAASCFLGLVLNKLEKQPHYILPIMSELAPALEFVAHNQDLFKADERIYGNFLELRGRIHALWQTYGGV
jgi:hypothetical protein